MNKIQAYKLSILEQFMSEIKNSYHFIYAIKIKFQQNGNYNK